MDLTDFNPQKKINSQFANLDSVRNWVSKRLTADEMREATRKMMLQKMMNKISQSSKTVEKSNDKVPDTGLSGAE